MTVQSSGSIVSARAVEPTTSENSAVTGLRSPVSLAARIMSMSGAGALLVRPAWTTSYAIRALTSASYRRAIARLLCYRTEHVGGPGQARSVFFQAEDGIRDTQPLRR